MKGKWTRESKKWIYTFQVGDVQYTGLHIVLPCHAEGIPCGVRGDIRPIDASDAMVLPSPSEEILA